MFPSAGGHLRDPKNTNRDLRRAYNNAGRPDITSHTFRRSVATAMTPPASPRAWQPTNSATNRSR